MPDILPRLLEILVQAVAVIGVPPGSFVYHLVLLFALGVTTAIAIVGWWRGRNPVAVRLALAAGLLVLVRLAAFSVALLSAANILDGYAIIPPLERTTSTLAVILLIWAFAFPERARLADAVAGILVVLALLALGTTFPLWQQEVAAGAPFYNFGLDASGAPLGSLQEPYWEIAQLALLGGGLILLSVRRKDNWLVGLLIVLLLMAGHALHLLFKPAGNLPGAVRYLEALAAPLLWVMATRRTWLPLARPEAAEVVEAAPAAEAVADEEAAPPVEAPGPVLETPLEITQPSVPPPPMEPAEPLAPTVPSVAPSPSAPPESGKIKWALDPKAALALASLNAAGSPDELAQILVTAVAYTFRSDLCLLIAPPDASGAASVICAYDLIRERMLRGFVIPLPEMLTIESALLQGQAVRLTRDAHEAELRRLAFAIGYEQIGPALVASLLNANRQPIGGLILFSPYAQREWTDDDEALLAEMVAPLATSLGITETLARLNADVVRIAAQADTAGQELRLAQAEAARLTDDVDLARAEASRLADELALAQAEIQQLQYEADTRQAALEDELETLQAKTPTAPVEAEAPERLKAELDQALARLEVLSQFETRLDAALRETAEHEQRERELEVALERAQTEALALTAQLTGTAAQTEANERLKTELAETRQRLEALAQTEAQLEAAREETDAQRERVIELEAALATAREEWDYINAQMKAPPSPEVLERLRAELEAAQQEAAERVRLESQLLAAQQRLADLAALESKMEAASRALGESERRAEDLQAEVERLRLERTALSIEAQATASAREALAQREAQLAEARAQHAQWQAALAEAQQQVASLPAWQSELAEVRGQLQALQSTEAQLAEARAQHAQLQAALAEAQQQVAALPALQSELADARRQREARQALEAELIEAQRQIEGFRQREGEAAEAQLQAEARYQLEAELQSMRQQLEAQALSDANLRLESEGHQQQEFQLRRELELTRAELRKLSERAMTMGPESEGASPEAQEALEALKAELAEKSRELLAAQSALATTRNEIADQAKSLVVIREMLSKREKQLADLRATRAMPDEAGETGPSSTELKELLEARERQLAKAQAALSALQEQMQSVTASTQTQIAAKDRELVEAQAAVTRLQEISPNFEALRAQVAEKEKQLEKAQEVMTKLSRQVQAAATAREELLEKERQVTEAQAALTRLQEKSAKELAAARAQLAEGEKQSGADAAAPPSLEVIASLTQDLRQPMSSIVGYSDMLLGEKAGILGELQKKFLERIIASCERMEAQLDDLIRVTAIDSGRLKLARDALDVLSVVDEAVMSCRAQFREKGINLRLDIEDDLPSVVADREALREILTHLLNNAGSASTIDGEVVLTVRRESEQPLGGDPIHYLFVSMQDSGGGIALSDQPRVFSRLYRADAPLIAGLGDTGVGLSIAKALVEAQGGRIWLTSEIGRGSTFSVLLPADMRAAEAVAGNGFEPVQAPSPEPSRA